MQLENQKQGQIVNCCSISSSNVRLDLQEKFDALKLKQTSSLSCKDKDDQDRDPREMSLLQQRDNEQQTNLTQNKRKLGQWAKQQQLEYYYGSIQFKLDNPQCSISWKKWKPDHFYNAIQAHMARIFTDNPKNSKQCKTKDQNFKIKYTKSSVKSMDLLKLCTFKLSQFVNLTKIKERQGLKVTKSDQDRSIRFREMLKRCKQFTEQSTKKYAYQEYLQKYMDYTNQNQGFIDSLSKLL